MNRTKWRRARFADRPPTKSKTARYDRDNALAASVILSAPERHAPVQVDWARRFQQRQARERGADGPTGH